MKTFKQFIREMDEPSDSYLRSKTNLEISSGSKGVSHPDNTVTRELGKTFSSDAEADQYAKSQGVKSDKTIYNPTGGTFRLQQRLSTVGDTTTSRQLSVTTNPNNNSRETFDKEMSVTKIPKKDLYEGVPMVEKVIKELNQQLAPKMQDRFAPSTAPTLNKQDYVRGGVDTISQNPFMNKPGNVNIAKKSSTIPYKQEVVQHTNDVLKGQKTTQHSPAEYNSMTPAERSSSNEVNRLNTAITNKPAEQVPTIGRVQYNQDRTGMVPAPAKTATNEPANMASSQENRLSNVSKGSQISQLQRDAGYNDIGNK